MSYICFCAWPLSAITLSKLTDRTHAVLLHYAPGSDVTDITARFFRCNTIRKKQNTAEEQLNEAGTFV